MLPDLDDEIAQRAAVLFHEHRQRIYRRTDRLFAGLMLFQWVAAIVAAVWISPLTWTGIVSETHVHVWAAIFLGGAMTLFPVLAVVLWPGTAFTRHTVAVGQMLMSALLIHLTGGRIETHFHVFGSLAFLAFYRDWTVFGPATLVVAADHYLRGVYWPESVYGVAAAGTWRWLEHAAWVIFEDTFLIHACRQGVREIQDIARQRAELEATNRRTERTVLERTQELRASEERFRSLSAASPLGIFQTDARGRTVYTNARWGEIAGVAPETGLGDGWVNALHPEDRGGVIAEWTAAVREGRATVREFRMLTPSDDVRWVQVLTNVMRSDDGEIVGHVGTLEDITERKRAEEGLTHQARELARSNAELEQFAYVASHDLQEPLRMVASFTQLLARRYQGKLDGEAQEFIAYAVDGVTRMHALINALLTYSRVGTGGIAFKPTDCEAVLARALADLQVAIQESGALVTHDPLPTVVADDVQLAQLLANLILNAVKFRDHKPPRIHVKAERREREWVFSVSDNGIGIDPAQSERIFVIFQRLHDKDDYPGTGIGLAICKKIVERHAGRMWVESEPGKGSTFYFTLPVAPEATAWRRPARFPTGDDVEGGRATG
jgi:PAS domain S-box-containing protein